MGDLSSLNPRGSDVDRRSNDAWLACALGRDPFLILGPAYVAGASTLMIMFLYPVHQSLGQINGTMLYATERVGLKVLTGSVFMIVGTIATYLVLAPRSASIPGLGLASDGLGIKMVALQVVSVNVVGYLIAHTFKWRFDWVFQPIGLLTCVALGWGVHRLVGATWASTLPLLLQMTVAGVVYLVLIAGVIFSFPWLTGMTQEELVAQVREFSGHR